MASNRQGLWLLHSHGEAARLCIITGNQGLAFFTSSNVASMAQGFKSSLMKEPRVSMSQVSSGHITLPKQLLEPGQTRVSCMREGDPSVCLREGRTGSDGDPMSRLHSTAAKYFNKIPFRNCRPVMGKRVADNWEGTEKVCCLWSISDRILGIESDEESGKSEPSHGNTSCISKGFLVSCSHVLNKPVWDILPRKVG